MSDGDIVGLAKKWADAFLVHDELRTRLESAKHAEEKAAEELERLTWAFREYVQGTTTVRVVNVSDDEVVLVQHHETTTPYSNLPKVSLVAKDR